MPSYQEMLRGNQVAGTRDLRPPVRVQEAQSGLPGTTASPLWVQDAVWHSMPWRGRRLGITPPPYRFLLAAGAPQAVLVNLVLNTEELVNIQSIECTVDEPGGRPFVQFNIFKNDVLLDETKGNFTTNHPLSPTVAQDVRLTQSQKFRIAAGNTNLALPFTAIIRVEGWIMSTRDYAPKDAFDAQ